MFTCSRPCSALGYTMTLFGKSRRWTTCVN
jgi:hypothetical protein